VVSPGHLSGSLGTILEHPHMSKGWKHQVVSPGQLSGSLGTILEHPHVPKGGRTK